MVCLILWYYHCLLPWFYTMILSVYCHGFYIVILPLSICKYHIPWYYHSLYRPKCPMFLIIIFYCHSLIPWYCQSIAMVLNHISMVYCNSLIPWYCQSFTMVLYDIGTIYCHCFIPWYYHGLVTVLHHDIGGTVYTLSRVCVDMVGDMPQERNLDCARSVWWCACSLCCCLQ